MPKDSVTRRQFAALGAAAILRAQTAAHARPTLCLFSKHLPKLNYSELGRTVKQMGFDGVDLTVRPEGHVLPQRVAEDLPRAVDTLGAAGLKVPMITTGLTSAQDPAARPTLETAGRLGIPFFKLGYWRYTRGIPVEERLDQVRRDVQDLVAIAKAHRVVAGYHNHSGDYVGAAVWDIRAIIGGMDPHAIGYYFDPCHATAEGGEGGWKIALEMVLPRLKMVALKDFYWEKSGRGWEMKMCPMGQGMVRWREVFSILAQARFAGPISLHMEYDPPDTVEAIARDFEFVRKQVQLSNGGIS